MFTYIVGDYFSFSFPHVILIVLQCMGPDLLHNLGVDDTVDLETLPDVAAAILYAAQNKACQDSEHSKHSERPSAAAGQSKAKV